MRPTPPTDILIDDAEVVARVQHRDQDMISSVVLRYHRPLYRYVVALTHDHHLAEDIVGDTLLRMLETIGDYQYHGISLQAWLYRIAHNLTLNHQRRARRRVPLTDAWVAAGPPADPDPAQIVVACGERQQVQAALARLTPAQQQVLRHRYVAEHSARGNGVAAPHHGGCGEVVAVPRATPPQPRACRVTRTTVGIDIAFLPPRSHG